MLDRLNPYAVTGLSRGQAGPSTNGAVPMPGIARTAVSNADANPSILHPDNPVFWFGAIAAVTLGLIAANASIKVGPFKAAVGASK